MSGTDKIRFVLFLLSFYWAGIAHSQLTIVAIPRETAAQSFQTRTTQLPAMRLPFWDDFSLVKENGYANDTIWESSRSVWINDGVGINPPSIRVATFDGLDSIGKPYNITDILAKGIADKLLSRRIRLDLVAAPDRPTTFLSFYYQIKGRGEQPDLDDNLSLWFLDVNNAWVKVWEASSQQSLDPARFYFASVALNDDSYFHENFRFRFQNFARLSGSYDAWNLDYVYLASGRSSNDRSMPDRMLSTRMSSPLGKYSCIPVTHYRDTASEISVPPAISLYGMLQNNFQPFRYTLRAEVTQRVDGKDSLSMIILDDDAVPVDPITGAAQVIAPFQLLKLTTASTFAADAIDERADSVHVRLRLGINTADDNPLTYLPKYVPINFLWNDSTVHEFELHNYYAYDDGGPEYAAGLNAPGLELAYGYDLLRRDYDTLVAVNIHFPEFGDQSNQSLTLRIWSDENGKPGSVLHQQSITVTRTTQGRLTAYPLSVTIPVSGRYYVGWKQNSSGVIPAGFDKNFDSKKEIFFLKDGTWAQDTTVAGSLMIRPVFGKGDGNVVTGLTSKENQRLWPNPSSGQFSLPQGARIISIHNISGQVVPFAIHMKPDATQVEMEKPVPGLYLVRWSDHSRIRISRLIIR